MGRIQLSQAESSLIHPPLRRPLLLQGADASQASVGAFSHKKPLAASFKRKERRNASGYPQWLASHSHLPRGIKTKQWFKEVGLQERVPQEHKNHKSRSYKGSKQWNLQGAPLKSSSSAMRTMKWSQDWEKLQQVGADAAIRRKGRVQRNFSIKNKQTMSKHMKTSGL